MPSAASGRKNCGVVGGDDQVGRHCDLEAATHRHAVDRRDHGHGSVGEVGEAAEAAGAVVGVERLALGGCAEVPAGTEEPLACAGDDGDSHRGVVFEADECLAHCVAGGRVDGVGLRAVDGEDGDAVARPRR